MGWSPTMDRRKEISAIQVSLKGKGYDKKLDELYELGNEYNKVADSFTKDIILHNDELNRGRIEHIPQITQRSAECRKRYEDYRIKEKEVEKYEVELKEVQDEVAVSLGKDPLFYRDNSIISRPYLKNATLPFQSADKGFDIDIVDPYSLDYQMCIRELSALRGEPVEKTEEEFKNNLRLGTIGDYGRTFERMYKEADLHNILALDLETNSLSPAQGNIIEFGCVDSEGNEYDELFSPSERQLEANGVGLTELHNITEKMVNGKPTFISQSSQILDMMMGKTILVHNKGFELNWFRQQIEGFEEAEEEGQIQVADTMHICQKFCPTERNRLKDFVEYTGGEYKDAHRSSKDAEMTLEALKRWREM